jgi:predicted amidohydrolase YtcJ
VSGRLVVTGRIATLAGSSGFGWVEALAIDDGRVVAAGTDADLSGFERGGTRRLALGPDEVATPGLTDAHVHLLEAALAGEQADLSRAATLEEGLAIVRAAHKALDDPDAWLEGGGWDPTRWGRWPAADDLERAAPGRRVALWAHDHHALLASRAALHEAGIDDGTADPPGGAIARASDGRPTGVLHEHASRLVTARIPPPADARLDAAIERWCRGLLSHGIVAIHDLGPLSPDAQLAGAFAAAGRLDARGWLPVRVHAGIREESLDEAIRRGLRTGERISGDGFGRGRVGWWKRFADGSLGSRTAFLREPYERESGQRAERLPGRGMPLVDRDELRAGVRRAARAGIATAVHAIGDAALDIAVDALTPDAADEVGTTAARPRIEHAQLVHDEQLDRLARAAIALSMQPVHVVSDGRSIVPAWGDRGRRLGYRWRSAVEHDVALAFGTDAPVEDPNPWPGLAAAVDRTERSIGAAAAAVDPTEAVPLDVALRSACLVPAQIAGERDRGRLTVGQRADLVVIERPAGTPLGDAEVVRATRPRVVVLDGEIVVER